MAIGVNVFKQRSLTRNGRIRLFIIIFHPEPTDEGYGRYTGRWTVIDWLNIACRPHRPEHDFGTESFRKLCTATTYIGKCVIRQWSNNDNNRYGGEEDKKVYRNR